MYLHVPWMVWRDQVDAVELGAGSVSTVGPEVLFWGFAHTKSRKFAPGSLLINLTTFVNLYQAGQGYIWSWGKDLYFYLSAPPQEHVDQGSV